MSHTLSQIPSQPPGDDVRGFLPGEKPAHIVSWGLGRYLGQGMGHDTLRVIS